MHINSRRLFAAFYALTLLPTIWALCAPADAQILEVQATGTVTYDTDVTGKFFGFGVSPTPTHPMGTAVGQPVVLNFAVNLATMPTFNYGSAPPPVGFGNPNRAYYFSTGSWVGWVGLIGSNAVPELPAISRVSSVQLWSAYGSLPVYNEFDIDSTRITTPYGVPGLVEETTLRVDSVTTPFLNGLSVAQSWAWTSAMDDGLSTAVIEVLNTAGDQFIADADIHLNSVNATVVGADEPGGLSMALLFAIGIVSVILLPRRRKSRIAHFSTIAPDSQ